MKRSYLLLRTILFTIAFLHFTGNHAIGQVTGDARTFLSCLGWTITARPLPGGDGVYLEVDEMPEFKGGNAALLKYIAENTKYPDEARKNNITGKVLVKFVVEKDGSVSNVGVEQGVDYLLDSEAYRVVSSLPKFEKPAIKNGKEVAVQLMLPISFALK